MAEIKVNAGDPKTKRTYTFTISEDDRSSVHGKRIGDTIRGELIGKSGYELQITGGSDRAGFPMRPDVDGTGRRKILTTNSLGNRRTKGGDRVRKTVAGNTVSAETSQLNVKVVKHGKTPLAEEATEKEEPAKEEQTEKAEKPEDAPKEEKEPAKKEEPEESEEKKAEPEKEPAEKEKEPEKTAEEPEEEQETSEEAETEKASEDKAEEPEDEKPAEKPKPAEAEKGDEDTGKAEKPDPDAYDVEFVQEDAKK